MQKYTFLILILNAILAPFIIFDYLNSNICYPLILSLIIVLVNLFKNIQNSYQGDNSKVYNKLREVGLAIGLLLLYFGKLLS